MEIKRGHPHQEIFRKGTGEPLCSSGAWLCSCLWWAQGFHHWSCLSFHSELFQPGHQQDWWVLPTDEQSSCQHRAVGCAVSLLVDTFSFMILYSGCPCQKFRLAPHPVPVLPGLQPLLYSGLPPSGGSTQLPQFISGSCPQLGTGKLLLQFVEPCGQTLPTAHHRALLWEVHWPFNLWTRHTGFTAKSGYLGICYSNCGLHHYSLWTFLVTKGCYKVLDSTDTLLYNAGGLYPR